MNATDNSKANTSLLSWLYSLMSRAPMSNPVPRDHSTAHGLYRLIMLTWRPLDRLLNVGVLTTCIALVQMHTWWPAVWVVLLIGVMVIAVRGVLEARYLDRQSYQPTDFEGNPIGRSARRQQDEDENAEASARWYRFLMPEGNPLPVEFEFPRKLYARLEAALYILALVLVLWAFGVLIAANQAETVATLPPLFFVAFGTYAGLAIVNSAIDIHYWGERD